MQKKCGTLVTAADVQLFRARVAAARENASVAAVGAGETFYCPVVFHLLVGASFPGRTALAAGAVTPAHLESLIESRLNPDFSASNADISEKLGDLRGSYATDFSQTALTTSGTIGNARIQFYLAKGLAGGNIRTVAASSLVAFGLHETSGYVNGNGTQITDAQDLYDALVAASPLAPQCMNLYITTLATGLLGFAFVNTNVGCFDWTTIGQGVNGNLTYANTFANGRTITHELGHAFGLPHTFDGAGDGFADTPAQINPNYDATFVTGWKVTATIAGEAAGDSAGEALAMSADGTRLVVGAPSRDTASGTVANGGYVRVFDWNGSAWVPVGDPIEGTVADERLGASVAIGGVGNNTIAVGSREMTPTNSGRVRVYAWSGSAWAQVGNAITGSGVAFETFGFSVAVSADGAVPRVAVGAIGTLSVASSVRVFELDGGGVWQPLGGGDIGAPYTMGVRTGSSIALSPDGNRVVFGADSDQQGRVRVVDWDGDSWTQVGTPIPGVALNDFWGTSVAIAAGNTNVIAAGGTGRDSSRGHARVYRFDAGGTDDWVLVGAEILGAAAGDRCGSAVALSADGTRVAVGSRMFDGGTVAVPLANSGHVRVFDLQVDGGGAESWAQLFSGKIEGTAAETALGNAVAISSDGKRVAAAAPWPLGTAVGYVLVSDLQVHGAYCNHERDAFVLNAAIGAAPGWTAPAGWGAAPVSPPDVGADVFSSGGAAGGSYEMFMNFMDYSGDRDMLIFTSNQVAAMRTSANSGLALYGSGASPFAAPANTAVAATSVTTTGATISFALSTTAVGELTTTVFVSENAAEVADAAAIAAPAPGRLSFAAAPGATSVAVTGLAVATTYHFNVLAEDSATPAGAVAYTPSSFATASSLTMPVDTSISIASGPFSTTVSLAWAPATTNEVAGVTYSVVIADSFANLDTTPPLVEDQTAASYDATGLAAMTPYWVRVTATDGVQTLSYDVAAGTPTFTTTATLTMSSLVCTPDATQSATAFTLTAGGTVVTPVGANPNLVFDAYVSTLPGAENTPAVVTGTSVPIVSGVAPTFTFTAENAGIAAGTTYYARFRVRHGPEEVLLNEVTVPTATALAFSGGNTLTVTTPPNNGPVEISWASATGGASGTITYELRVDTVSPPLAIIPAPATSPATVAGLAGSTNYFAQVVAISGLDSLEYAIASFTTTGPLHANGPLLITNVNIDAFADTLSASWAPSSGGVVPYAKHTFLLGLAAADVQALGTPGFTIDVGGTETVGTHLLLPGTLSTVQYVNFSVTDSEPATAFFATPVSTVALPADTTIAVGNAAVSSLSLSWDAATTGAGATVTYDVFMSTTAADLTTITDDTFLIATTTANTHDATGFTNNTTYYFKVGARNAAYAPNVWTLFPTAFSGTTLALPFALTSTAAPVISNATLTTFDVDCSAAVPVGGVPPYTYRAFYSGNEAVSGSQVGNDETSPTFSVDISAENLTSGKTYFVSVRVSDSATPTPSSLDTVYGSYQTPVVPLVPPASLAVSVEVVASDGVTGAITEFNLVVEPPTGGNGAIFWRIATSAAAGAPSVVFLTLAALTGMTPADLAPLLSDVTRSQLFLQAFTESGDLPQYLAYEPVHFGTTLLSFDGAPTTTSTSAAGPKTLRFTLNGGSSGAFAYRMFVVSPHTNLAPGATSLTAIAPVTGAVTLGTNVAEVLPTPTATVTATTPETVTVTMPLSAVPQATFAFLSVVVADDMGTPPVESPLVFYVPPAVSLGTPPPNQNSVTLTIYRAPGVVAPPPLSFRVAESGTELSTAQKIEIRELLEVVVQRLEGHEDATVVINWAKLDNDKMQVNFVIKPLAASAAAQKAIVQGDAEDIGGIAFGDSGWIFWWSIAENNFQTETPPAAEVPQPRRRAAPVWPLVLALLLVLVVGLVGVLLAIRFS
jgi:hypothetical protein